MCSQLVTIWISVALAACSVKPATFTPDDSQIATQPDSIPQRTVTVTHSGTGGGTVTSANGLACGTTCSVTVADGTTVELTAIADTTSMFTGWSGASCAGTAGCTIVVTSDTAVDASFDQSRLTIVRSGHGAGTVVSSPPGIDCGSQCSAVFAPDTKVTLTAAADAVSAFTGWSGACSGTGSCVVTFAAAQTVMADFACTGTTTLTYANSIQTFPVPVCAAQITVDAYGAQGGHGAALSGGLGARITGTFAITGMLKVLVGGMGDSVANGTGGGGGGTFVYMNENDASPLIAAGGGGGISSNGGNCTAGPGSATVVPSTSSLGAGNATGGANGTGGGGGTMTGSPTIPGTGGGGAGWTGDGANGTVAAAGGGGKAPRNTGAGGVLGVGGGNGGFGGGGASAATSGACGGGGGYNGGGGGNGWNGSAWGCGGGGGSFNGGTLPSNMEGVRAGNGQVTFTWQ
jgi:hypothetical protein